MALKVKSSRWTSIFGGAVALAAGVALAAFPLYAPDRAKDVPWQTIVLGGVAFTGAGLFLLLWRSIKWVDAERGEITERTYLGFIAWGEKTLRFGEAQSVTVTSEWRSIGNRQRAIVFPICVVGSEGTLEIEAAWSKRAAADLSREVAKHLGVKVVSSPRFLA